MNTKNKWSSVTTGRCIGILTTTVLDAVEDDVRPYLNVGNFYEGFQTYLYHIQAIMQKYQNKEWESENSIPACRSI